MNTSQMFALYDTMSFAELADQLEELDGDRTPTGWSPRQATHRSSLERRIVAIAIARQDSSGDPDRIVRCELDLRLRSRVRVGPATLLGVGQGGIVIRADGRWRLGTVLDVEIHHDTTDEHGPRIRGSVVAVDGDDLRLQILTPRSEAEDRRARRFILDALRHRVQWTVAFGDALTRAGGGPCPG